MSLAPRSQMLLPYHGKGCVKKPQRRVTSFRQLTLSPTYTITTLQYHQSARSPTCMAVSLTRHTRNHVPHKAKGTRRQLPRHHAYHACCWTNASSILSADPLLRFSQPTLVVHGWSVGIQPGPTIAEQQNALAFMTCTPSIRQRAGSGCVNCSLLP